MIKEILKLVNNDKNYISEVKQLDLNEKDESLLISVFEYLKEGNDKQALHLLEWVGDTYIREKFADLVLKG